MLLYLLSLINPLVLDDHLSQLATQRAEIVYSDWSHNNWKSSFKDTDCAYQGENLAIGFNSEIDLFLAFLNSPTHYKNISNRNYTHIGIGKHKDAVAILFCGIIKVNDIPRNTNNY